MYIFHAKWPGGLTNALLMHICNTLVAIPKLKLRGFPSLLVNVQVEVHRFPGVYRFTVGWCAYGRCTESRIMEPDMHCTQYIWLVKNTKARARSVHGLTHTQLCNISTVLNRNMALITSNGGGACRLTLPPGCSIPGDTNRDLYNWTNCWA